MPQLRITALSLLCCLALLTGCGRTTVTLIKIDRLTPPDALLTCADQPEPPAGTLTQAGVAGYIVSALDAGEDCRQKLGAVKKWADEQKSAAGK